MDVASGAVAPRSPLPYRPCGPEATSAPSPVIRLLRRTALLVLVLLAIVAVDGLMRERWMQVRRERLSHGTARAPTSVEHLGAFPRELVETSGLAVSRRHAGVFWTHNDSGDGPRVYAVDRSARLLGAWTLEGADAVDWEDIAEGPCPSDADRACLFVADTGNNARGRDTLTVYVVPEPDPSEPGAAPPFARLRYRYPDDPRDAEALAVGPGGELAIVTKGRTGTVELFVVAADALRAAIRVDTVITLATGRPLPFDPDARLGRHVTGAGLDPSGTTLAVRTYTELFFYRWPVEGGWVEAAPPCLLIDADRGGEAVAFDPDGGFLLTAEGARGRPATLTRVRCAGISPPP